MLSRVAEAIFWMNRYVERAENVARFVDVNLHLALDFPEADAQWEPLVATTGDADQYRARYGTISRGEVLQFLTFDRDNPSSILSCLSAARENARSVRDVVSSEVFEQVNRAFLAVNDAARCGTGLDAPHDFYTQVKLASHLFVGTMDLTMTHNEGWHFGRLGRMLERADKTSRILDLKSAMLESQQTELPSPTDELHWSAVLRSASAFEMYRKERGNVLPTRVVEFLILNDRFPRSVLYCLNKADGSLHAITGTKRGSGSLRPERELGRLASELAYAEVTDILDRGLHGFVDDLQLRMNRVAEEITSTFFAVPLPGTEPRPKTLPPLSGVR
jgi:uncharacterized alpha-E superfamily protein